ncbi:MAG: thiamine-phosphate kinase [Cyanobacteria bacterium P01_G01_bin.4]
MDTQDNSVVGELGETGLLKLVQRFCLPGTVGDDAALQPAPTSNLVITTDVLVESVHFSDRTTPPHSVGWRAAAANLSDLAAMGAFPISLVIALGLPNDTPVDWVEDLYQGISDCCQPWNTGLVGGDLSRSQQRFLSITALGDVHPERAIRRNRAQPGDVLVATGPHGSSRAGLELLLHPELAASVNADARQQAIAAHQYPKPRLDLLPYLQKAWEIGGRIAGMDTSDGLADAVVQVCTMSSVGAQLEQDTLPIAPWLTKHFGDRAVEWSLYGGEDFELLLSMPPAAAELLIDSVDGVVAIGIVTDDEAIVVKDVGNLDRSSGFQHFQTTTE